MSNVLDHQVVANIVHLARLSNNPSNEFLEKYSRELGAVLNYVAELNKVDTSSVTNVLGSARVVTLDDLSDDEPYPNQIEFENTRKNIIANFPNRQGDLLVLAGIFEN